MAGKYTAVKANPGGLIACFIFLQLFFSFGANTTTFVSERPLPIPSLPPSSFLLLALSPSL
ncbi:hypothetical protein B0H19DRAFT_1148215 [Mycena capillaripes]|nr:hypothetical protein B0H19DRAFT_1148215 [Mycena capillaripes]